MNLRSDLKEQGGKVSLKNSFDCGRLVQMTALNRYKAYTLIEMLIVLGIFILISAIGFSSFYGLKDSISMNEKVLSVSQDFRYAQRAALFLERKEDDKWIYGIGIDFSSAKSTGKYRLFKWCSQFDQYGDTRTTGIIPNFDKAFSVSGLNGNLPVSSVTNECNSGLSTTELALLPDTGERTMGGFVVDLPTSNDAVGDVGGVPAYVLFEAVSGRAFFYDSTGNIVNYDSTGTIVSTPISFKISVASTRTKTRKTLVVSNISGKVDVQTDKIQ